MRMNLVIDALRQRCPSFAGRVAGAAQFKSLPEATALAVPSAFVIPLDDNPAENLSRNGTRQALQDSFAVIVALSNVQDERGQAGATSLHDLRRELWAALLGWQPEADYDGIVYEGGQALSLDRARFWYQFEFSAAMEIGTEDGYQPTELAACPDFTGVDLKVDLIDPKDPNRPGITDGRIEAGATINLP